MGARERNGGIVVSVGAISYRLMPDVCINSLLVLGCCVGVGSGQRPIQLCWGGGPGHVRLPNDRAPREYNAIVGMLQVIVWGKIKST